MEDPKGERDVLLSVAAGLLFVASLAGNSVLLVVSYRTNVFKSTGQAKLVIAHSALVDIFAAFDCLTSSLGFYDKNLVARHRILCEVDAFRAGVAKSQSHNALIILALNRYFLARLPSCCQMPFTRFKAYVCIVCSWSVSLVICVLLKASNHSPVYGSNFGSCFYELTPISGFVLFAFRVVSVILIISCYTCIFLKVKKQAKILRGHRKQPIASQSSGAVKKNDNRSEPQEENDRNQEEAPDGSSSINLPGSCRVGEFPRDKEFTVDHNEGNQPSTKSGTKDVNAVKSPATRSANPPEEAIEIETPLGSSCCAGKDTTSIRDKQPLALVSATKEFVVGASKETLGDVSFGRTAPGNSNVQSLPAFLAGANEAGPSTLDDQESKPEVGHPIKALSNKLSVICPTNEDSASGSTDKRAVTPAAAKTLGKRSQQRHDHKLLLAIVIITIYCLVTATPSMILTAYKDLPVSLEAAILINRLTVLLYYSSYSMNMIVFSIVNKEFRLAVKRIFGFS